VFILKILKVVCFDTLLQVLILKDVSGSRFCDADPGVDGGEWEAALARRGCSAMFTAHSRRYLPAAGKLGANDSRGKYAGTTGRRDG